MFGWLNAREATEIGESLAKEFALKARGANAPGAFVQRAVQKIQALNMNFYKRARLLNAFRWRLLESGVDSDTAIEATQTIVLQLTMKQKASLARAAQTAAAEATAQAKEQSERVGHESPRQLLNEANAAFAAGAYARAVELYECLRLREAGRADVLSRFGAALCHVGRYRDAEQVFRKLIRKDSKSAEGHANLGSVLLVAGAFAEAENALRRALQLKPDALSVRANLGLVLISLGRFPEARSQLQKVLRAAPRHADALHGLGVLARTEGLFEEAADFFERALAAEPKMVRAWAASAGLRKLKTSDLAWLQRGEKFVASAELGPHDEATARFALGKYYDDTGDYQRAFKSYKRANDLARQMSPPYSRAARSAMVDDLICTYTPQVLAGAVAGGSDSVKPILVVGMMRSGTSLIEQILASHRDVAGAGELTFWIETMRRQESDARRGILSSALRTQLAASYLQLLARHSVTASRVVDKLPANSDYLGMIHSVFPRARIVYVRRDPIDTCLSCYFQHFQAPLSFSTDLSDLVHYYRQHQRLMEHWRAVLPAGTLFEIPYEGLVSQPQEWIRRLTEFLALEWDERCLSFHDTQRTVATASFWQVRQRLYRDSVQRWHHYRKFIGPLLELQET